MSDLVCAHKWSPPFNSKRFFEPEKVVPEFRTCNRCREIWRTGDPEPRVVIARLE